MKEEEEDVEHCDLIANSVYLGLLESDSVQDEVFFFEPLLEEKLVGGCLRDLVKWVEMLPFHDRRSCALVVGFSH